MTVDELAKELNVISIHAVSRLRQQARYIAELESHVQDLQYKNQLLVNRLEVITGVKNED